LIWIAPDQIALDHEAFQHTLRCFRPQSSSDEHSLDPILTTRLRWQAFPRRSK
jgi:hypothetical protein